MSIDSILFDRLKDAAGGLDDLVAQRIYWARAPQNDSLPYVVLTPIVKTPVPAMGSDPSLRRWRIQIDGFSSAAAGYDGSRALEAAIDARVRRWRSAGPPVVQETFVIDTTGPVYDEAAEVFRVTLQIEVNFEES